MKYYINKGAFLTLCYVLMISVVVIFMRANTSFLNADKQMIDLEGSTSQYKLLKTVDVYETTNHKSLSDFFSENDALERIKACNTMLHAAFNFIEFQNQDLLAKSDFQYKEKFRVDYGTSAYGHNDDIGINFLSFQIDNDFYKMFDLDHYIMQGRGFESLDFIWKSEKESDIVYAILGNEYTGMVAIGDTIDFSYLTKDITVKVIGILAKDTSVVIDNEITFLDNVIVIPSFNIKGTPQNAEDSRFQKILYATKNWGYVRMESGDDYQVYKSKLNQFNADLGLEYIFLDSSVSDYIVNVSETLASVKGVQFIVSLVICAIVFVVFYALCVWCYNQNRTT